MASHKIIIQADNDVVGTPPSSDGVMMMFLYGVGTADFVLGTPYLLTDVTGLADLGIDQDYDDTNETDIFGQVSDFYNQGLSGAQLWLVGVPMNTEYTTYGAGAAVKTLIRFTRQADPAQRAKMIAFGYAPPQALQQATDFNADCVTARPVLQAMQQAMFLEGSQFSILLDGNGMSSTVAPAALASLTTENNFAVSQVITGVRPNGMGGIGAALGRFARISVGHGVGTVEDGPVFGSGAYLTNCVLVPVAGVLIVGHTYTVFAGEVTYNAVVYQPGAQFQAIIGHLAYTTDQEGYVVDNVTPVGDIPGSTINGLQPSDIDALGDKQFMFLRTWLDTAGFFWNDGATATATNKAFSSQEYNRCVNKLSANALAFFITQEGKNLPLDTSTGNVAQGWLNSKQEFFYTTYIKPLKVNEGTGDISDASMVVTGPAFLANKQLQFVLSIVPTVILGDVTGIVKFVATLP